MKSLPIAASTAKLFILSLVILLMAMTVSACKGDDEIEVVKSDFSVYLGNTLDPITVQAVIDSYKEETGLVVEPVYSDAAAKQNESLKRMLKARDPVAAFLGIEGDELTSLLESGYAAPLAKLVNQVPIARESDLVDGNRLALSWNASGLIASIDTVQDMFGNVDVSQLITDMQTASYEEFADFVVKADDYIVNGNPYACTFSGREYAFAPAKTELTAKLSGVFALTGSDKNVIGSRLMYAMLAQIDTEPWLTYKDLPDEELIAVLKPGITPYFGTLDLLSSHLAGRYAVGKRGDTWTSSKNYSLQETEKIFVNGKALFTFDSTKSYDTFTEINSDEVDGLVFLPVKFPFGDLAVRDERRNTKIALSPRDTFAVNSKAPKEMQANAAAFIVRLHAVLAEERNSMQKSAASYWATSSYFPFESKSPDVDKYLDGIFKKNPDFNALLSNDIWTPEGVDAVINQFAIAWKTA